MRLGDRPPGVHGPEAAAGDGGYRGAMSGHAPDSPVLGVIGGGAMAEAIIGGALDAGALTPDRVAVADPNPERRRVFEARSIRAFEPGPGLASWLGDRGGRPHVLLAVKPQMLPDASAAFAPSLRPIAPLTIASILAGVTRAGLAAAFGEGHGYVRLMPNTPAAVRRGVTALARSDDAADTSFVHALFEAVGVVLEMPEPMIDAFTGVAGSGPAYVFYLAEALARAAQDVGFDAATARTLAERTVIGSAELLRVFDDDAGTLRARVTSKRGTTEAAVGVLDEAGVMDALRRAVAAARDRGRELGAS